MGFNIISFKAKYSNNFTICIFIYNLNCILNIYGGKNSKKNPNKHIQKQIGNKSMLWRFGIMQCEKLEKAISDRKVNNQSAWDISCTDFTVGL